MKMDTAPLDTNLTSFFRYIIVNFALWGLILLKGKLPEFGKIKGKTWLFILFGGVASAVAHVLVYKALFFGKASVVITVYRMGMVISVILSKIVLKEKLSPRGWTGFAVLTAGVVTFALGR